MELRRLLKKIRCGLRDSDYENVVLTRIPRYFFLILALFAVVVTIPTTSALPPAPYLPTGPDHGQHIDASYFPNGQISSYLVGNDVTNGGGAGNVFYTIYGDHLSLTSKNFSMESGETVTVWAELCPGICSIIPAQTLYWNVRASQAGDTDVGSLTVTPYTPPTHGFSGTPVSGPAPLTVKFTDTSAGDWTVWSWNFGDGGTGTTPEPLTHLFTSGYVTTSSCLYRFLAIKVHPIHEIITLRSHLVLRQDHPRLASSTAVTGISIPMATGCLLVVTSIVPMEQPAGHKLSETGMEMGRAR